MGRQGHARVITFSGGMLMKEGEGRGESDAYPAYARGCRVACAGGISEVGPLLQYALGLRSGMRQLYVLDFCCGMR